MCRINYSDHHRDSVFNGVSAETVKDYYQARKFILARPRPKHTLKEPDIKPSPKTHPNLK